MKANRILSILLALGLAVVVPVGAVGEPNSYEPIITQQLPAIKGYSLYARVGFNLRLGVRAKLPEMPAGVEGALSYTWWYKEFNYGTWTAIPSATDEKLVLPMTKDMLGPNKAGDRFVFRVVVTNTYVDAEGNEQADSAASETTVILSHGIVDFIVMMWNAVPSAFKDFSILAPLLLPYSFAVGVFNIVLAYPGTFFRWIRYLF